MDHDQFFFGAFHDYHLDSPTVGVVTKADKPAVEHVRVSCGSGLLEAETTVSDDMTDALLGYAMLGRRACESHTPLRYVSTSVRHKCLQTSSAVALPFPMIACVCDGYRRVWRMRLRSGRGRGPYRGGRRGDGRGSLRL